MSEPVTISVFETLARVMPAVAVGSGAAAAIASIAGALKAGVLTRLRLGNIEIEATTPEARAFQQAYKETISSGRDRVTISGGQSSITSNDEAVPFEVKQLSSYYSQTLSQSKISFWFSLVFASVGFAVIVSSAFLYKEGDGSATVFQFTSGVIVDAVAALFFVQSKNAQKSMWEFFDKLRKDRLHMESRKLCDEISSKDAQDSLRVHLALEYAGIADAKEIGAKISDTCLSNAKQE